MNLLHLGEILKIRDFHVRVLFAFLPKNFYPEIGGLGGLHVIRPHFVVENDGWFPRTERIVLEREGLGSDGWPASASLGARRRRGETEGHKDSEQRVQNSGPRDWGRLEGILRRAEHARSVENAALPSKRQ